MIIKLCKKLFIKFWNILIYEKIYLTNNFFLGNKIIILNYLIKVLEFVKKERGVNWEWWGFHKIGLEGTWLNSPSVLLKVERIFSKFVSDLQVTCKFITINSLLVSIYSKAMGRKFFVGGNWKMNGTKSEINDIVDFLKKGPLDSNVGMFFL